MEVEFIIIIPLKGELKRSFTMKSMKIFMILAIFFLVITPQFSQAGQEERMSRQNTFVFAGQKKYVDQLKELIAPRCQYMRSIHIGTSIDIVDVWGPPKNGKANEKRFATPILGQSGILLSERNNQKIITLTNECAGSPYINADFHPDSITDLSLNHFIPVQSSDDYVVAQIMPLIVKGDPSRWTIGSIVGDNGFDVIYATRTLAIRYHITASGKVSMWTFRNGSEAKIIFPEKWDDNQYAHQAMKFSDLILRDKESIGLAFTNHEEDKFGWFVYPTE